jgi:hypothetical protein
MPKGPPAPSTAVDLALVLAIDESGSVDDGRCSLKATVKHFRAGNFLQPCRPGASRGSP